MWKTSLFIRIPSVCFCRMVFRCLCQYSCIVANSYLTDDLFLSQVHFCFRLREAARAWSYIFSILWSRAMPPLEGEFAFGTHYWNAIENRLFSNNGMILSWRTLYIVNIILDRVHCPQLKEPSNIITQHEHWICYAIFFVDFVPSAQNDLFPFF